MAYKRSVYIKAKETLDNRKKKAEQEREIRHAEVIMKCPEIHEVETEMAKCGADVVKAIGMGADAVEFVKNLEIKNLASQEKRHFLLKEAGYPEDYLDARYTCSICKDTGYHGAFFCSCYKKLIREIAREELSANSPLKKCTFNTFSLKYYPDVEDKTLGVNQKEYMTRVFDYCKNYAENFTPSSPSILMTGKTGLGKTHLSLAIANKVLDKGFDVFYDSIQNIMDNLEREHFGKLPAQDSIREDILNCDLLIIDDLGVEFSTQFTVSELHNIINTRLLRSLPTIISTNLEMNELEQKYTQRIASRIMGSYYPLRFFGKDIRQLK